MRTTLKVLSLGLAVTSHVVFSGVVHAQDSVRVVPGWGIDTSSTGSGNYTTQGPVPEIYRAWRDYLRSDATRQSPTKFWSAAEQRKWSRYDVAGGYAYQGFPATVLSIQLAQPGVSDEYVVRTLFASTDGPTNDVKPIALTRVYAIRENGHWVFANALPRLTRDWKRHLVGHVNYIVEPGHTFDEGKARNAVRFADSVAVAFGVQPITNLDYYVTDTPEEIHRILGLDFIVGGEQASYSDPGRQMILVGSSVFGENHRHELTHSALAPLTWTPNTAEIVNEGTATWFGGSLGKSFPQVMRDYAAFLGANPTITLDSVLTVKDHDLGTRPAGAALVEMTSQHGGIAALKALMASGRTTAQLRAGLEKALGMPWTEIGQAWRAHVLGYALPAK
ncbi:MAG TPA: hypothetical protein VK544_01310 [Gemmatimonadaceae bacterium]|nr:hypothetical protein [Gemmatimonadaceae bacterium]